LNACFLYVLSERSVDSTLCGYCVRPSGEKLGYTGGVETSFSKTERGTKTSSSSADNNGIVFVVDNGVFAGDEARRFLCPQVLGSENTLRWPGGRESSCGWAEAPRELRGEC
jgi:hypothetical protein